MSGRRLDERAIPRDVVDRLGKKILETLALRRAACEDEMYAHPTKEELMTDPLELAIGAVLFNTSNYPERAQPYLLGTDTTPLREKLVAAVRATQAAPIDRDSFDALAEFREVRAFIRAECPHPPTLERLDAVIAHLSAAPGEGERPYDEYTDHVYSVWDVDDVEEHALDMLAVVRHRRAQEMTP